ncbi:hypothetical protein [Colwellia sp. MT41]|uniref:hypothetical protein n=1 Tax=Colwellia sp. MT41 TaxID=58049 RepID=UPI001E31A197|nr:hypothetical protein [Colwellia sp. MT41]
MFNLPIPTTPSGDYYKQRNNPQPAFNQDLFQQLLEPMNLQRAWQRVKANKGAAGIDDMSIDAFSLWAQQGGWQTCKTQLEQGEYQPNAVRRVEIDKPDGGK